MGANDVLEQLEAAKECAATVETENTRLRNELKQARNSIQHQRELLQSRKDVWMARYGYVYDQLQQLRASVRKKEAEAVNAQMGATSE